MSDFNVMYPPRSKLTFDGGLNTKFEKSLIEDNESPDCRNVVFGAGSVGTRDGFVRVNTTSVGSFVCDGLYARQGSNNAETMVAFFGGHGFTLGTTTFVTIPSAQSVFTAGIRIAGAQMENHLFLGNGGVTPYKYNGTDFTRHGVPQPSGTVSAASNGVGVLSGTYTWKISYVNSAAAEGNPSDALVSFAVSAKQVRLTSLPIAPQSWGVGSRRLYRNTDSGTTFFRVATIPDNTTTTFDDNVADGALGTVATTDNGEPPIYSAICYHRNRLFMIGSDGLVWYTNLNEPYTVASTSFLPIGDQATDFPKALAVHGDMLVVFGEMSPWIVFMPDNDPTTWQVIRAKSDVTSKSHFGTFPYGDKLAFPAMQNDKFVGIGALRGIALDPTSSLLPVATVGGELKSDRIEPDMFDVQDAQAPNISSIVFRNKAYISLTKGSGNTANNRIYVMDFSIQNLNKNQKETWVPWTGLSASQFAIYNGNLYFGTSLATGYVYRMSEGTYSDDGSAIDSYFWTKEFSGLDGDESNNKDFRFTNFLVDLAGQYFMDIAWKTDSDSGMGTNYQVDVRTEGSLLGSMIWGVDLWGGGATQKDIRVPLAGARGKRIQYKFSNQNVAGQRFKVHWQNFTYNRKGPR